MFNVLPNNFKASIESEYKKRRIIVWFVTSILLQLSFCVFLFPSYIYLVIEQKNVSAENLPSTEDTNITNNIQALQSINQKISVLSLDMASKNIQTILSDLVSLKGTDVTLTEITYQNMTATSSTLSLRGVAKSREALLGLEQRYQSDPLFDQVNLPVSDFAKDTNISFSLTMVANM